MRSSSISLDGYGSKIRKVSGCRPAGSNETILATRQEFFFIKVAPLQSTTDTVLLDFWLMLLSWMFISSYTTIYIFVKNFIFFANVYVSVKTIFECLYRGHQLSTYATGNWWGMWDYPKCVQLHTGRGDVTTDVYVCFYFITFHVFGSIFVL